MSEWDVIIESALKAQRHQRWTPEPMEQLLARHERKALIPKTPLAAHVYLQPRGRIAWSLMGAQVITLR